MPELPVRKIIGSKHYRLYAALVNTRHADGTPRLITVIRDQDVVSLAGGEEFVTLYLPEINWTQNKTKSHEQSPDKEPW